MFLEIRYSGLPRIFRSMAAIPLGRSLISQRLRPWPRESLLALLGSRSCKTDSEDTFKLKAPGFAPHNLKFIERVDAGAFARVNLGELAPTMRLPAIDLDAMPNPDNPRVMRGSGFIFLSPTTSRMTGSRNSCGYFLCTVAFVSHS